MGLLNRIAAVYRQNRPCNVVRGCGGQENRGALQLLRLRPAPGTEQLLLGGLLKSVIDLGLQKEDWLAKNCDRISS